MMRFVPPAGTPLRISQILSSLVNGSPSNGHPEQCLQTVRGLLGVKHVFAMSSGRAALWLALRSLHQLKPHRDTVAVPAYTCFSVPAAIVRAGLKIHPIEVNPSTLDFDLKQLAAVPEERLLCVVPCNLFGFPNDISAIRVVARSKGAFVIDDAAQALGSAREGKLAGTMGDLGIYSLGRGKSLGSVAGGLLVTDSDEIATTVKSEREKLSRLDAEDGSRLLLKMVGYSVLIHPRLFWIPNSLPFLKLGTTQFDPHFPIGAMHSFSLFLLQRSLSELNGINQIRRANARRITAALRTHGNFESPDPQAASQPNFVRLPILARDQAIRDLAVTQLRDAGIGASAFYPHAICDIPGIEEHMSREDYHCPHSEELSRRLLTLPVHPFVKPYDIERMVNVLTAL